MWVEKHNYVLRDYFYKFFTNIQEIRNMWTVKYFFVYSVFNTSSVNFLDFAAQ